jgi:hypothetical protein
MARNHGDDIVPAERKVNRLGTKVDHGTVAIHDS